MHTCREDLMKFQNGLTDLQNRMSMAVEKLSGQLELREKVRGKVELGRAAGKLLRQGGSQTGI
jgi:hypothetical protein